MKENRLLFNHPAWSWNNATPVGNGCMGAMLYGRVDEERLVLNEEHIWNGDKLPQPKESCRERLDQIRQMFLEGKNEEADRWMNSDAFDGIFHCVKSYEYAGEIRIRLHADDECGDYSRELRLDEGVARIAYGRKHHRTLIASAPRRLIAYRFTAEDRFSVAFQRENIQSISAQNGTLTAICTTADGQHPFCVAIRVLTDGRLMDAEQTVDVQGATWGEVYVSIISSYCEEKYVEKAISLLDEGCALGWEAFYQEHVADFSALMNRSDIDIETDSSLYEQTLDMRLHRLRLDENARDAGLFALYYQFGRYLMVSSSRPGSLPANLQGIWSSGIKAPWNSDFHTNINLQMNYWPVEVANLSECALPLFDYMNHTLMPSGCETAEKLYEMRGMVVHHLSDLYGYTGPADGIWGMWPIGGAWLAFHMWEHYLYTRDLDFLRNQAYEYIRQNVLFFLDNMFVDSQGRMLSGPSASPENTYFVNGKGSYAATLSLSPTMDVEVIGGLMRLYLEAEALLNLDPETAGAAREALDRMPPLQIGRHGQLMEWLEDYDEPEPGHRHISHGFALYPDCAISRKTPELLEAMRVTMERRLSHGGGHTGWSRAWLILMFARLRNAARANDNMLELLRRSTFDNLFDAHPPFQIDGNFGGAAGVAEMLMHSHEDMISLLPALSAEYTAGSFRGLCARGGYVVDAVWADGQITGFSISSPEETVLTLELPDSQRSACFVAGDGTAVSADGHLVQLTLHKGNNPFTLHV